MIVCGIDPGVRGAIAMIDTDGEVRVYDMPVYVETVTTTRAGKRRKVNVTKLDEPAFESLMLGDQRKPDIVVLEEQWVRPDDGAVSAGRIMRQFGFIQGVVRAYGIRCLEVKPQVWQRIIFGAQAGKGTKVIGGEIAEKLFPSLSFRTKRGRLLDGRSDAVLIAEYGRRVIGKVA